MDKDLLIARIELLCQKRNIRMNTAFTESKVGKNFKANLATSNPSIGKLTLLANYFGVPVAYLTGETDYSSEDTSEPTEKSLTPDELKLIQAYREHPEMHEAINRLLLRSDAPPAHIPYKLAAHGGENEAYEDDDEPKTT